MALIGNTGKRAILVLHLEYTNISKGVGKSALINALLSHHVLPEGAGARSTTRVPFKISYSSNARFYATLVFTDGKRDKPEQFDAPHEIANSILTWQHRSNLKYIEVVGPFPLLRNTTIIDMPGFFDIDASRITQAFNTLYELHTSATTLHLWWLSEPRLRQEKIITEIAEMVEKVTKKPTGNARSGEVLRIIVQKQVQTSYEMVLRTFQDIHDHLHENIWGSYHKAYPNLICISWDLIDLSKSTTLANS